MGLVPRAKLFSGSTQHLIPDSLTQSAGVVTAVIGAATLTVNVGSPAANTLYYLYLRMNGPTSTLFSVVTIPSVYRASFPEAILIGAYYSNGVASPAFGSFVNINGTPRTQKMQFTPALTGFGTATNIVFYAERSGGVLVCQGTFTAGTTANVLFSAALPTNLVIDSTLLSITGNTTAAAGSDVGYWLANTASPQRTDAITAPGTSTTLIYLGGGNSTPMVPNATSTTMASNQVSACNYTVPIVGWSNVPLKDL